MKIAFAIGGRYDIQLHIREFKSLEDFYKIFLVPPDGAKSSAGYFIRGGDLNFYKEYITTKGTVHTNIYPRINEALNSADILIIDADTGPSGKAPTIELLSKALIKLGFNHFGYTTSSHTPEKPKCRIILPCKIDNLGNLDPTMDALKSLLSEVKCFPQAGGSEERTWVIPWYMPTQIPGYKTVSYFKGRDFIQVKVLATTKPDIDENTTQINEIISIITKGEENTHLHEYTRNLAYGLIKDGVTPAQTKAILFGLMSGYEGTPRQVENKSKVNSLVDSAASKRWAILSDWEEPKLPPMLSARNQVKFPTHILPDTMLDAAKAIADFCMMSEDNIILSMIVATSMCIGRKAQFHEGSESIQKYFHLALFNIGKSGSFKSTVFNNVIKGLKDAESAKLESYELEGLRNADLLVSIDSELAKAKKSKNKHKDQILSLADLIANNTSKELDSLRLKKLSLENARIPGMFIDNATEEASIVKCHRAGGAINYVADEGQGIADSWSSLYKSGKSSTDFSIRGLSGSHYANDRLNREVNFRPVMNILTFVQPDIYEEKILNNTHINTSGLYARLLANWWPDFDYDLRKNSDNVNIRLADIQPYWDATYRLSYTSDEDFPNRYEIDDVKKASCLMRPITKLIVTPKVQDRCNKIFNSVWLRYATDLKGQDEVLNKCLGVAYTAAACLYAYENYTTFFTSTVHEWTDAMLDKVEALLDYILKIKVKESSYRRLVISVKGAKRVFKSLTSKTALKQSLEGRTERDFKFVLNYIVSKSQDEIDAGVELLTELNILKVIYDTKLKIVLTPKWKQVKSGFDDELF